MASIEEQLLLEERMVSRGQETYLKLQRKAEENDRGADLDYSRRLMQEYMQQLIDAFTEMMILKGAGRYGRAKGLLMRIEADKAVYITLRTLFNSFMNDNQQIVDIAARIGKLIEDEIRFARFQEMHGAYYSTIVADFKRKGTKDYRYMHRVLTHSANEQGDQWEPWDQPERVDVGCRMIDVVLQNCDLFQKVHIKAGRKQQVFIKPTPKAEEWIKNHENAAQFLFPDRAPCIIEPDDWSDLDQGGYYSPQLRQHTPMVKTSGGLQKKWLRKADLTKLKETLNIMQKTAWSINTEVLSVVKTVWAQNLGIGIPQSAKLVPEDFILKDKDKTTFNEEEQALFMEWKREAAEIYTAEKERVGQSFQITRILRMANDYAMHKDFWYVWYADFRGRLYTATAGFSPQGPDVAKGLLQFSRGKPLGPRGFFWLKVHGANRYGYDKTDYADRVQWVDERHEEFVRAGNDPLSHRETWANADKPYQFLAFLLEYAKIDRLRELGIDAEHFVSHLAVGLDGSCNGLQNFSAMLRDPIGGAATNLLPSNRPADIYTQVARVCTEKVRSSGAPYMDGWRDFINQYGSEYDGNMFLPRSVAKRPVMTLPYGATRQSCTKYLFLSIIETDRKLFTQNFGAACSMTPLLWDSIGEVVVAAREAMSWLQKASSVMTKAGLPIIWTTPDGFVAVQNSKKVDTVQIETQLMGRFQIRVGHYTDKISGAKQRQGISPNFVHSYDATHLRTTVRNVAKLGITDMALIHDDYGTYAADTHILHRAIRESFVEIYTQHDPLADFKREQEEAGVKLPPLPAKGSLNILDVLKSPYFFG